MIVINITGTGKDLQTISVEGHAEYDESGKDIVCSAVSSLVFNTINSLTKLTDEDFEYSLDENKIQIQRCGQNKDGGLLLASLELGLQSIYREYSNYLEIYYKEV